MHGRCSDLGVNIALAQIMQHDAYRRPFQLRFAVLE